MDRTLALVLVASLGACYQQPSVTSCKYLCGGANNDTCPSNLSCNSEGRCVLPGEGCTDDGGVIDAPSDAIADAAVTLCATPGAYVLEAQALRLAAQGLLHSVVVLDANSDGLMDVVVTDGNVNANAIGMFPGRGDGTFGERIGSPGTAPSGRLAIGAFDGDGVVNDLVVVGAAGYTVHRGTTSGGFSVEYVAHAGTNPSDLELVDIDGEMLPDLFIAYAGMQTPGVTLFAGQNGGTWQETNSVSTGGAHPIAITVAKVDSDASFDLAVADETNDAILFYAGTAQPFNYENATSFVVGDRPRAIAAGSLSPGEMSVVTANILSNNVSVLTHGVQGFASATHAATHDGPRALVLVDVNVDGALDIVTANTEDTITVLLNDGAGVFPMTSRSDYAAGDGPGDIASGDFNGDGRPDLAVANLQDDTISIFLNGCPP